jgi:hypothetical protein
MFGFDRDKQAYKSLPEVPVLPTDEQFATLAGLPHDEAGMILLGEITRNVFGRQVQYISYYFDGIGGAIDATEGLRVTKGSSYHQYAIHRTMCSCSSAE